MIPIISKIDIWGYIAMKIVVLGSGMMGQAIAYDLYNYSKFDYVTIADKDKKILQSANDFLNKKEIDFQKINIEKTELVTDFLKNYDIAVSAVPYKYNYKLAKIAIESKTHFLDLGGNNDIVKKERSLTKMAKLNEITIIPDCGLAPGLTSIITKDIVGQMDGLEYVKIRVGGLPINPKPPLNYQIVFSPYGLINEYIEDSIILNKGDIIKKPSMTEIEEITFPDPFGTMEAFLTSGGCSTLPYTYNKKINYLDYKTIRYKGHCEQIKPLLDIKPKEKLVKYLEDTLPKNEKDVVLLKVLSKGKINCKDTKLDYLMIDYYDNKNNITSMMRTTAYPTSIIAILIEKNIINRNGVFCPEEVVPCDPFFKELEKRKIKIKKIKNDI
jgi:lysine 6-dehydrogenase